MRTTEEEIRTLPPPPNPESQEELRPRVPLTLHTNSLSPTRGQVEETPGEQSPGSEVSEVETVGPVLLR